MTRTVAPASRAATAAQRPAMPAPAMHMSAFSCLIARWFPLLGRKRGGTLRQDVGLTQRLVEPGNLAIAQLAQRRANHGIVDAAQNAQALLHAVVHVTKGRCVEYLRQRVDPVVDLLRKSQILGLNRLEKFDLQFRNDTAGTR